MRRAVGDNGRERYEETGGYFSAVRADVYCRRVERRSNHRNIAEGSVVFLKAEAENKVGKLGIVAMVEHRVITPASVHFNDEIDFGLEFGCNKLVGTSAAALLVLAKQHVALEVPNQLHNHIHSATVIASDALRRHYVPHIL